MSKQVSISQEVLNVLIDKMFTSKGNGITRSTVERTVKELGLDYVDNVGEATLYLSMSLTGDLPNFNDLYKGSRYMVDTANDSRIIAEFFRFLPLSNQIEYTTGSNLEVHHFCPLKEWLDAKPVATPFKSKPSNLY